MQTFVPADLPSNPKPLRVLIVEDDRTAALVVKMMLVQSGCQAVIARDGKEAFQLADELGPDVVLLDYELPDITGLELLKRWRETSSGSGLAVIALTGHVCEDVQRDMIAAGANGVCTKPVSRATLLQEIRNVRGSANGASS